MPSLKNWDNKTWLSSKKYIYFFNKFILKQIKLNKHSKVLDIGCGRGRIIGNLSYKLKFINKPIGLDIQNHKDKSKKIDFINTDGYSFISKTKNTFDLILIKQTIHLFKKNQIKKFLSICKKKLNQKGKIIILGLDTEMNEFPTFNLMSNKLRKSLKRDKEIFNLIYKLFPKTKTKYFSFNVNILKKNYIKMIKNRFISILLDLTDSQIKDGLNEINSKYKKNLKFKDKLICFILE